MDPGRGRVRGRDRRRPTALRRALREPRPARWSRPGLVNTHHHLYQTLTRTRAQEADLFTWLKTLYPLWGRVDADAEYAAARTGLAELVLGGCTTVFDHHYVFPPGKTGLVEAEIEAARELGVRIVASRGSMDVGESEGGLPPDDLVEDMDAVLADTEGLYALHEEGPGAWTQIAVAPCSPFSVSKRLMTESAALARKLDLRLHTHLAETIEEEEYCKGLFGCRPVEYLEQLGWLASDVWCAHCVHLSAGRRAGVRLGRDGRRALPDVEPPARRRRGAGARDDRGRACRWASAWTARRRTSAATSSADVKQALLVARGRGGPDAMTVREALWLGTRGGAQVLGRKDLGSLEPGKCADFAVWNMDGLQFGGADDPVAALILSGPHRAERVYVGGEAAVLEGQLARADEREIAAAHRVQAARFLSD